MPDTPRDVAVLGGGGAGRPERAGGVALENSFRR